MHLILFLLFLLSGCKKEATVTHFQGNAHTHSYHIQIGKSLRHCEKEAITSILHDIFETVDTYYNHWNTLSELSQVNQLLVGENFSLSPELLSLLRKAQSLTLLTEGHFDPTYGALISLWKDGLKVRRIPLQAGMQPIGWNAFSFQKGKATRLIAGVTIDLDGLLKGFTVDQIVEKLHEKGFSDFYVEWSGEIRTSGNHPTGRKWVVTLPFFGEKIELSDKALATSGNEHQSCEINGTLYSHIVIPQTRTAIPLIKSVSVEASNCLFADALATAFMTYPSIKAILMYLDIHKDLFKGCRVWVTNLQGESEKWQHTVH